MTDHGDRSGGAIGGPVRHVPVLLAEVLAALAPQAGGRYLDGTFGAGGYSRAILDAAPDVTLLGLDRDPTAIAGGADLVAEMAGRLTLSQANFGELAEEAERFKMAPLDGVVLDIGVSSMQIDQAERGFSFRFDGPLDMRMARAGESAADLVARLDETALANLIYTYGEERLSRPIARAIVRERAAEPIVTTRRLADIVARVVRSKPGDIHPATRTFQALRIAVNDELDQLGALLDAAGQVVRTGGIVAIISFHSLEDRIVKRAFVDRPIWQPITKKPVVAGEPEVAQNPRARSAKLRAARRVEEPSFDVEDSDA